MNEEATVNPLRSRIHGKAHATDRTQVRVDLIHVAPGGADRAGRHRNQCWGVDVAEKLQRVGENAAHHRVLLVRVQPPLAAHPREGIGRNARTARDQHPVTYHCCVECGVLVQGNTVEGDTLDLLGRRLPVRGRGSPNGVENLVELLARQAGVLGLEHEADSDVPQGLVLFAGRGNKHSQFTRHPAEDVVLRIEPGTLHRVAAETLVVRRIRPDAVNDLVPDELDVVPSHEERRFRGHDPGGGEGVRTLAQQRAGRPRQSGRIDISGDVDSHAVGGKLEGACKPMHRGVLIGAATAEEQLLREIREHEGQRSTGQTVRRFAEGCACRQAGTRILLEGSGEEGAAGAHQRITPIDADIECSPCRAFADQIDVCAVVAFDRCRSCPHSNPLVDGADECAKGRHVTDRRADEHARLATARFIVIVDDIAKRCEPAQVLRFRESDENFSAGPG